MNLGERQAYEAGRKDGWQEAIVALASGAKKLLGPGLVATLADALRAGIAAQPARAAEEDPTEPASWGRSPVADVQDHLQRFGVVEAAAGVARGEAHRAFVHPQLRLPAALGGGPRPGDEDRHTVGEHR